MTAFVSREDQDDIAAILRGDEAAAQRLYARYEPPVSQQIWRFTRDPHRHQELVQEVFVQIFMNLAKFRGKAPFLHWMRRIATHAGYRFWKREAREKERTKSLQQEQRSDPVATAPETPSEAAEQLHGLLARLKPDHRLVLTLFYFDECDVREIAERTGWSLSKVKVCNLRARAKLKQLLEEAGYER